MHKHKKSDNQNQTDLNQKLNQSLIQKNDPTPVPDPVPAPVPDPVPEPVILPDFIKEFEKQRNDLKKNLIKAEKVKTEKEKLDNVRKSWNQEINPVDSVWVRRLPSRDELENIRSKVSKTMDDYESIAFDLNKNGENSDLGRQNAIEKKEGMGLAIIPAAISEGLLEIGTFLPDMFNPNWGSKIKVDKETGFNYYIPNAVSAQSVRKDIGAAFGSEGMQRDPSAWYSQLAFTGGKIATGFFAMKAAGSLFRLGKVVTGFKSAASVDALVFSMAKLTAKVPAIVRVATEGALLEQITLSRSRDGLATPIYHFLTGQTPDESEATVTYLALQGKDKKSAAKKLAQNFVEDTLLNMGFDVIFGSIIKRATSKKIPNTTVKQIQAMEDEVAQKLLPQLDIMVKAARGTPEFLKAEAAFNEAYKQIDVQLLEFAEVATQEIVSEFKPIKSEDFFSGTKTLADQETKVLEVLTVDKQAAKMNDAVATENLDLIEILNSQNVLRFKLKKGEVQTYIDDTGKNRINSLLNVDNTRIGVNLRSVKDEFDKMTNKEVDEIVADFHENIKNGDYTKNIEVDDASTGDALLRKMITNLDTPINGNNILEQYVSDLQKFKNFMDGIVISEKQRFQYFKLFMDAYDISRDQFVEFGKKAGKENTLMSTIMILTKREVLVRDVVLKTAEAGDQIDDIFLLQDTIASYLKSQNHALLAKGLTTAKNLDLKTTRMNLEAVELIQMKVEGFKTELYSDLRDFGLKIGDDDSLKFVLNRLDDLSEKLPAKFIKKMKSQGAILEEEVKSSMGGDAGVTDARTVINEMLGITEDSSAIKAINPNELIKNATKPAGKSIDDIEAAFSKVKTPFGSQFMGFVYNSKLSSPTTAAKIVVGGAVQTIFVNFTRAVGSAFDLAIKTAGRDADKIAKAKNDLLEVFTEIGNLIKSTGEASRSGFRTFIKRESQFSESSLNEFRQNSPTRYDTDIEYTKIDGAWGRAKQGVKQVGNVAKFAGSVMTQNVIGSVDEFFKVLTFRASMVTELKKALRNGSEIVPNGKTEAAWIEEQIVKQMGTQDTVIGITAMKKAKNITFQTNPVAKSTITKTGEKIKFDKNFMELAGQGEAKTVPFSIANFQKIIQKFPLVGLILMFPKMIANVADEFLESVPGLVPVMARIKFIDHVGRRLKERAFGPANLWKKQAVIGKQIAFIGSSVAMWGLIEDGTIQGTAGLSFKEQKKLKDQGTFLSYSIKIGDERFAFTQLIEPVGTMFRVITRTEEILQAVLLDDTISNQKKGKIIRKTNDASAVFIDLLNEIIDATPLKGVSDTLKTVAQPTEADLFNEILQMGHPLSGLDRFLSRNSNIKVESNWKQKFIKKSGYGLKTLNFFLESIDLNGLSDFMDENAPVDVYDMRTGEKMISPSLWLDAFAIKSNPASDNPTDNFFASNGPYIKMNYLTTDPSGLALTSEKQSEYRKILSKVKINGKTMYDAITKNIRIIEKNKIPDATVFLDDNARKLSPAINIINTTIRTYSKLAKEKFYDINPNFKAAKVISEMIKTAARKGKPISKINEDILRKGTVEDLETIRQQIIREFEANPQDAFQK